MTQSTVTSPCDRCGGTGTYRQFGPNWHRDSRRYVNELMTGPCQHCDGTGQVKAPGSAGDLLDAVCDDLGLGKP